MYLIGFFALILLVAGLYLYMHNFKLYEQAKKDEALGVVREDTKSARAQMEAMRGEAEMPQVKYVAMTPPDFGKLP